MKIQAVPLTEGNNVIVASALATTSSRSLPVPMFESSHDDSSPDRMFLIPKASTNMPPPASDVDTVGTIGVTLAAIITIILGYFIFSFKSAPVPDVPDKENNTLPYTIFSLDWPCCAAWAFLIFPLMVLTKFYSSDSIRPDQKPGDSSSENCKAIGCAEVFTGDAATTAPTTTTKASSTEATTAESPLPNADPKSITPTLNKKDAHSKKEKDKSTLYEPEVGMFLPNNPPKGSYLPQKNQINNGSK